VKGAELVVHRLILVGRSFEHVPPQGYGRCVFLANELQVTGRTGRNGGTDAWRTDAWPGWAGGCYECA